MRVLITGAGGPVGSAIASGLTADGTQVVLTSVTPERLEATRVAVSETSPEEVLSLPCDLSSADAVSRLFDDVLSAGPLDAVIHCAFGHIGEDEGVSLSATSLRDLQSFAESSVLAAWVFTRELSKRVHPCKLILIGADWGVPLHNVLTSGRSDTEAVGNEAFVSAKYAITGLAVALDRQAGLSTTLIAPGTIDTDNIEGTDTLIPLSDVVELVRCSLHLNGTLRLGVLKPREANYDGLGL